MPLERSGEKWLDGFAKSNVKLNTFYIGLCGKSSFLNTSLYIMHVPQNWNLCKILRRPTSKKRRCAMNSNVARRYRPRSEKKIINWSWGKSILI